MIRVLYLISFIFLITGCSEKVVKQEDEIDLGINFNATSTIILHYQNAQDSVYLETRFYNFLPSDYVETETLLSNNKGVKELTFKIQHPQKVQLYYNDFEATCFLIPNDTLEIHIDLDTNQHIQKNMNYIGKYAALNNFYKNKELHFNKTADKINLSKALAFNAINTISEFSSIMDSLTQVEIDFINDYSNKNLLPKWFIDYEFTEIKCRTASSKLSVISYRKKMLKQEINLPENYYANIDSFMKDFTGSKNSFNYYNYITWNFQHIRASSNDTLDSLKQKPYHQQMIELSLKNLDEETSDIFLTSQISSLISRLSKASLSDSTYNLYSDAIQNKKFKKYLSQLKEEKEDFLKSGATAPAFMLPDINNDTFQLNDFKGNIVYLNFWFAGCAPCRAEFPHENELVEKYKDKKVKIINICTTTPKDNWKLVSDKFGLKMINLHANKVLTGFIEKNYDIHGYPHHVLIDPEGKIIQNKCSGAKNIEKEIDQLLEELN